MKDTASGVIMNIANKHRRGSNMGAASAYPKHRAKDSSLAARLILLCAALLVVGCSLPESFRPAQRWSSGDGGYQGWLSGDIADAEGRYRRPSASPVTDASSPGGIWRCPISWHPVWYSTRFRSFAILQDPSGVPYRYLQNDRWDLALYGIRQSHKKSFAGTPRWNCVLLSRWLA